jgi:hypothetical protein
VACALSIRASACLPACLSAGGRFAAVADQLERRGTAGGGGGGGGGGGSAAAGAAAWRRPTASSVRAAAASAMRAAPADYAPFLEGGDLHGYCERIESTREWGGQLELRALSESLGLAITVHSAGAMPLTVSERRRLLQQR